MRGHFTVAERFDHAGRRDDKELALAALDDLVVASAH